MSDYDLTCHDCMYSWFERVEDRGDLPYYCPNCGGTDVTDVRAAVPSEGTDHER